MKPILEVKNISKLKNLGGPVDSGMEFNLKRAISYYKEITKI